MRTRKQARNFGEDITNLEAYSGQIQNRRKRKGKINAEYQQPKDDANQKEMIQAKLDEFQIKDYYNDIVSYGHRYFETILQQETYVPKITFNSLLGINSLNQNINSNQENSKMTLFASSPELTQSMRDILVGWLIEVNYKMSFKQQTLYLTVYLVDRYCSSSRVQRATYQLLAMACLFVAGKFEEVATPKLKKIMNLCDKLYSPYDVLRMESDVLIELKFKISHPSLYWFINLQVTSIERSELILGLVQNSNMKKFRRRCHYLSQLCLFEINMLTKYSPQVISSAIIQVLSRQTQFISIDAKPCIQYLNQKELKLVRECSPNVRKIYNSKLEAKYEAVNCRYQDFDEQFKILEQQQ